MYFFVFFCQCQIKKFFFVKAYTTTYTTHTNQPSSQYVCVCFPLFCFTTFVSRDNIRRVKNKDGKKSFWGVVNFELERHTHTRKKRKRKKKLNLKCQTQGEKNRKIGKKRKKNLTRFFSHYFNIHIYIFEGGGGLEYLNIGENLKMAASDYLKLEKRNKLGKLF